MDFLAMQKYNCSEKPEKLRNQQSKCEVTQFLHMTIFAFSFVQQSLWIRPRGPSFPAFCVMQQPATEKRKISFSIFLFFEISLSISWETFIGI